MWKAQINNIDKDVHKIGLFEDNKQLSYDEVISYWSDNSEFRTFYFSSLEHATFDAFFWEGPPVTRSNIQQPYEFVLVNSPQLSKVNADPAPFRDKFMSPLTGKEVVVFQSLGGDAELIVPCPVAPQNNYAHFASFLRNAPEKQKHELFIALADSLRKKISDRPTWVSTSGLGVYWLHVRLDSRPKYYSYQAYRKYYE